MHSRPDDVPNDQFIQAIARRRGTYVILYFCAFGSRMCSGDVGTGYRVLWVRVPRCFCTDHWSSRRFRISHSLRSPDTRRRCQPRSCLSLSVIDDVQMNIYFALSAIYALGLRGIANKTALPYGPIGSLGVTRDTLVKLPISLEAAVLTFKREGSVAREVFGDYLVDHFAGTREHELELHRRAVTTWEGKLCSANTEGMADIIWEYSGTVYGVSIDSQTAVVSSRQRVISGVFPEVERLGDCRRGPLVGILCRVSPLRFAS